MIIKDNFLDQATFAQLRDGMHSSFFPWFFNETRDNLDQKDEIDQFQFVHHFFLNCQKSGHMDKLLIPFFDQLDAKCLIRVKANLNPWTHKLVKGVYHQDQPFKCKGAIYYINTNNGYTLFKKGNTKVNCVKNRLVLFDANEWHMATNCTDQKAKIVININYF